MKRKCYQSSLALKMTLTPDLAENLKLYIEEKATFLLILYAESATDQVWLLDLLLSVYVLPSLVFELVP